MAHSEHSDFEREGLRDEWRKRSEKWVRKVENSAPFRAQRHRRKHPLILTGYGISLRVDKGTLLICDGFTHYPQKQETTRYFPGDPAIPEHIIIVDGKGGFSLAVLDWLDEQGVTLTRIDWRGRSTTIVNGPHAGPNVELLKWQLETAADPEKRLEFSKSIILEKFESSLRVLEEFIPDTKECLEAVASTKSGVERIQAGDIESVDALMSLEGVVAKRYFRAWKGIELRWIKEKQYPVPPRWKVYKGRTSIANGDKFVNRNATHPINAMLNYAYAILEAKLRIHAISHGLHLRLGVFHQRQNYALDSFVFDLMEPVRANFDWVVLKVALSNSFCAKDFIQTANGVCRLSCALSKLIALECERIDIIMPIHQIH
nr:CRISPR-associated endonuclease Cas1 [uncultured Hyphomonas sp.]